MKIAELIEKLQKLYDEYGNIQIQHALYDPDEWPTDSKFVEDVELETIEFDTLEYDGTVTHDVVHYALIS